jgi:hypothetical protein
MSYSDPPRVLSEDPQWKALIRAKKAIGRVTKLPDVEPELLDDVSDLYRHADEVIRRHLERFGDG